jgi:hypothetical protein
MAGNSELEVLSGEITNTLKIIGVLYDKYKRFLSEELKNLGKKPITAAYLADIFNSFYTCLETLFLRISKYFENQLENERWHQDLLDKMTIEIPDIRIAAISSESFGKLKELLRFRHFRRYYFEMEYDWDKLDYLQKKFVELERPIKRDLERFHDFLKTLKITE